jgi:hypothetical protein
MYGKKTTSVKAMSKAGKMEKPVAKAMVAKKMVVKKSVEKEVMKQPKPAKSAVSSMFDYHNIYTGDPKNHPGIVKAKADKVKADSALAVYKNKSNAAKVKKKK